jgi:hypothetical protein
MTIGFCWCKPATHQGRGKQQVHQAGCVLLRPGYEGTLLLVARLACRLPVTALNAKVCRALGLQLVED